MNQREFAKRVLKISPSTWCQVLKGERNLGNDNAEKAAIVLATDKDIWRNPRLAKYRFPAWEKFSGEARQ